MSNSFKLEPQNEHSVESFKSYVLGFILSILLTLMAYFIVVKKMLSQAYMVYAIIGLGVIQAVIQLVLFLHLGKESKPKWNVISFLFMVVVFVIVFAGSIWIMDNLSHYNMSKM